MAINGDLHDRVIDRAGMLRMFETGLQNKVTSLINEHEIDIRNNLLDTQVRRRKTANFFGDLFGTVRRDFQSLAREQADFQYQNLSKSIGNIWRLKKARKSELDAVVDETYTLFSSPPKPYTLRQQFNAIATGQDKRVDQLIARLRADGLNDEAIVKQFARKGLLKTRNNTATIVRTGTTLTAARADQILFATNEELLRGMEYTAVLDSRTSAICSHHDGKVYPVDEKRYVPPLHYNCRSSLVPVVKSAADLEKENADQLKSRNLKAMDTRDRVALDGKVAPAEGYDEWLRRQPDPVVLRHFQGDTAKLNLFRKGEITIEKFTNPQGKALSLRSLAKATQDIFIPVNYRKLAVTQREKFRIDAISPKDLLTIPAARQQLKAWFQVQSRELNGHLSLTDYRGQSFDSKRNSRRKVTNDIGDKYWDPVAQTYRSPNLYTQAQDWYDHRKGLLARDVDEGLITADQQKWILDFVDSLKQDMGLNQRTVILSTLRNTFRQYNQKGLDWENAVGIFASNTSRSVLDLSKDLEASARRNTKLYKRLNEPGFEDTLLGKTTLDTIHDEFIPNLRKRQRWIDKTLPAIRDKLRDDKIFPGIVRRRMEENGSLDAFWTSTTKRLATGDGDPELDQLAYSIGKQAYELAGRRASPAEWRALGVKVINRAEKQGLIELEFGSWQTRRLKNVDSGRAYGEELASQRNVVLIRDKRLIEYRRLNRFIDLGERLGATTGRNRLYIKKGQTTYVDRFGRDTGIPVITRSAYADFEPDLLNKRFERALNHASDSLYEVDDVFTSFTQRLVLYKDHDNPVAFDNINHFKTFWTQAKVGDAEVGRSDGYLVFKTLDWLKGKTFRNPTKIDGRGRVYHTGIISPTGGEAIRPFINTARAKNLGQGGYKEFLTQAGATLDSVGGPDHIGPYDALLNTGRWGIAIRNREKLVELGGYIQRGKQKDIRAFLNDDLILHAGADEPKELGKLMRIALEAKRIDDWLEQNGDPKFPKYHAVNIARLEHPETGYKTKYMVENDASSSGAQIIALSTKNKALADFSNVTPTQAKQRLYDIIAADTFNDPVLGPKLRDLGITEKDLRKAAKASNMVTFYGAGLATQTANVESKLAKILAKQYTVITKGDRDAFNEAMLANLREIAVLRKRLDRDPDYYPTGISKESQRKRDIIDRLRDNPDLESDIERFRKDVNRNIDQAVPVDEELIELASELHPDAADMVEKMFTQSNGGIVSPRLFREIALNMSEKLADRAPVTQRFIEFWKFAAKTYVEDTGNIKIPWITFDGSKIYPGVYRSRRQIVGYGTAPDGTIYRTPITISKQKNPTVFEKISGDQSFGDIANPERAATGYGVSGNHSNDATIVRQFHLDGRKHGFETATIHDAFFTNIGDAVRGKELLRKSYADALDANTIQNTLRQMRKEGLSRKKYLELVRKAVDEGLIEVDDPLTREAILAPTAGVGSDNYDWYGVGP